MVKNSGPSEKIRIVWPKWFCCSSPTDHPNVGVGKWVGRVWVSWMKDRADHLIEAMKWMLFIDCLLRLSKFPLSLPVFLMFAAFHGRKCVPWTSADSIKVVCLFYFCRGCEQQVNLPFLWTSHIHRNMWLCYRLPTVTASALEEN